MTRVVSLLDPTPPGLGEEDLGGGGKGGTCGQAGPLGCHATHAFLRSPPPLGSTPLSPDLLRVRSGRRPVGATRPPERRRAAWAAGGESCEAAGLGLSCWLLGRQAVSQKHSWPFPHALGSHLAPHPFSPSLHEVSPRFPDSGISVHPEKGCRALQHPHPEPPTVVQVKRQEPGTSQSLASLAQRLTNS